ncbi:SurA N-terminal domain-containing protein [Thiopseudomonas alkaliphila]|uniref:SurA N-terminal domain-containing protein n=1 Tax=Thiopseudomonas alkaliphila TaxID=1697053 RepID=UPI0025762439|nr:SurA N-terminal domain-containing protein [Thiopseudomonas alkaliphila]MDM1707088.1 SurA N-terminal domain-containing protein [Thiopseudomonas alkaliphila]
MLQRIRDNSSGWVTKAIIGVIAVLLSFTGFEAIVSSMSDKNVAAKVNGVEITQNELLDATEMQRQEIARQFGTELDINLIDSNLLRQAALESLIARELQLQATQEAQIEFSSQLLDRYILLTPEFQVNGVFDKQRFEQVLQRLGYSPLQYRQALTQDLKINLLQAGIAGSEFATTQEVQAFAKLDRQTRDFSYQIIKADPSQQTIDQAAIEQYYQAHPERFNTVETAVVEYLELNKSDFFDGVELSDEELQEAYHKEIANLVEQRQAAHILFAANDKESFVQAEEKAQAAYERLQAGEDFAELAKAQSDDMGTAEDGGDLGFNGKGIFEASFETALYNLKQGEVSAPVQTADGWHLIKLLDIQKPEVPSFEQLKVQLTSKLKQDRVEQYFVEARQDLENAVYEAADLQQPAQDLGLKVKLAEQVTREGEAEGIFANRQVLQAVFSPEVLEDGLNSAVIELDPETAVVVHIKEHKLPELKPLTEVQELIKQQLIQEAAAAAAKQQGEQQLERLISQQQRVEGNEWKVHEAAPRNLDGVPFEILQAVFKQQRPAVNQPSFTGLALTNGDYALIQLKGVGEVEQSLTDEQLEALRNALAARKGKDSFAAFTTQLQKDAKIKYLEAK